MKRILALVMVGFLLLSVLGTLIYYLVTPLYAVEDNLFETEMTSDTESETDKETDTEPVTETTDGTEETPEDLPPQTGDDKLITVGLMYAGNVTVGFETKAPYGFSVNKVNIGTDRTWEPLWDIEGTKVSCTIDANLTKIAMTYSPTESTDRAVIGGWHGEISGNFTHTDILREIANIRGIATSYNLDLFPAYINGEYRIRIGDFPSEAAAANTLASLEAILEHYTLSVVGPSKTAVSVVDPETDKILFEYDDNDITAIGLEPLNSPEGEEAYLETPAKNNYDGIFMFRRYGAGVSVTNVMTLGDYTKGVVPYEIGNHWHIESQKALAVCVRSHLLYTSKHQTFDACNDPGCCQQYKGVNKVNDMVIEAVDSTAGEVIAYGGKGVCAYFSAVTGGCTVGNYEGFGGGQKPYLKAVDTPWEIYTNHSYGVWTKEISPAALCKYLQKKDGFEHLRGEIVSIETKTAENSTYIAEMTFTDSAGQSVTKKNNIYAFLLGGVGIRSANFVVGKDSVEGTKTTFSSVSADNLKTISADGISEIDETKKSPILTADGVVYSEISNSHAITAVGTTQYGSVNSVTEDITVYATTPGNFVFYGKGWGHGVGASQVGMRDLANLGYGYKTILQKYFTDIEIIDWRDSK